MAILISCRYDGNDANDGISLLEQGSVISVTSVITITGVMLCCRFFRHGEHLVAITGHACTAVCDP